jgi:hypothetical protein
VRARNVSDGKRREGARAWKLGQAKRTRGRKAGHARWGEAGHADGLCWAGPKTVKVKEISFLFLFNKFKGNFQMNFEFSFVFSKSAHNTKYYAAA